MKLTADRPFEPEAAARKLLEIVLAGDIDVGQHADTGVTNTALLRAGGSAGRDYAVAHGWFEIDSSSGSSSSRPARTFSASLFRRNARSTRS